MFRQLSLGILASVETAVAIMAQRTARADDQIARFRPTLIVTGLYPSTRLRVCRECGRDRTKALYRARKLISEHSSAPAASHLAIPVPLAHLPALPPSKPNSVATDLCSIGDFQSRF